MSELEQLNKLLKDVDSYFKPLVSSLEKTIISSGTDWRNYSDRQKKDIYMCTQMAQVIKSVLDASLLKEDGTLNDITSNVLEDGNKYLKMLGAI